MVRQRTANGGRQDPRRPTEQDREVGARLKALRNAADITQEALANALGVSYQQVQKYEKGTSRMSGGRLRQAAGLLRVPVQALIGEGATAAPGFEETGVPYDAGREGAELMRHFGSIRDPADRDMLLRLARLLAKG
ncbi:helix-turn-helix domain-containing protein [Enterovirga aerilata]|uniref:Helix-turn-helix transcriptional regulator n=1 Tax=Enterovirga aerilata TaxID=2730920 RepID=A0A849HTV3_9HYPH|nr:helix-turn-helix transcriptional regulator [Enterovirga sp. DB1703]